MFYAGIFDNVGKDQSLKGTEISLVHTVYKMYSDSKMPDGRVSFI